MTIGSISSSMSSYSSQLSALSSAGTSSSTPIPYSSISSNGGGDTIGDLISEAQKQSASDSAALTRMSLSVLI